MSKYTINISEKIEKATAEHRGDRRINEVYVLLSDSDFYDDLENLKAKYDIEPLPSIDDDYVDMYIAKFVRAKESGAVPRNEADEIQLFVDAITPFNDSLKAVLLRHGFDYKWMKDIKLYIARGELMAMYKEPSLINARKDPVTGDVIVRISPTASRIDRKIAMDIVAAEQVESIPKGKYQPLNYARRDSEITRYKASHSYKDTAANFKLDIDSTKKIVARQNRRLKSLKAGTS